MALTVAASVFTAAIWLSPEDDPLCLNASFADVVPAPAAFNLGLLTPDWVGVRPFAATGLPPPRGPRSPSVHAPCSSLHGLH